MFAFAAFTSNFARAQEDATQQQIDQINTQIQGLQAVMVSQDKHIQAMEKEISDLRDKLNQPDTNNFASADDLKKLAEQIQEIDKKRQQDNDLILKELEKLEKIGGLAVSAHKSQPDVSTSNSTNNNPTNTSPQKGYDYTIHAGDTLSAISKAYRDQGIKVTTEQILKTNPGLNPNAMKVGQKIFIPAPQP
jgi:LysM repeat protein